ncbi:hypothetical protein [uncultured Paludibaculum sp.]|uniref:hypothetical protein n=1 Tax=uncultured Paludibaculum sp. TaxID=1765020 RepID=UPI002AAB6DE6|nr:hypothetical protein [uncultured Paludibaculum sp.]
MKWTALLLAASAVCQAQQFSTGQAARLVIGQLPYTAQDPGISEKVLGSIGGVAYAADTLVVADSNGIGGSPINNRVVIYKNVGQFVPDRRAAFPQTSDRCNACVGTAAVVLGQPDFYTGQIVDSNVDGTIDYKDIPATAADSLRRPLGVAYNGRILAVADTDNNRVLIWKSLPTVNKQPADLVVGQTSFTTAKTGTSATTLRGPEAVWVDDNNGLWVADTGNSRVLYYGEVTQNGPSAKFALGQKDLNSDQQLAAFPDYKTTARTLLSPTSVAVSGSRVFVADLGANRVLIWNQIPTQTEQPADLVLGQPDMTSNVNNNSSELCPSNGTDENDEPTYPDRCGRTLEMPRAVISDGTRLYVADAGNDRVLVWNSMPTETAQVADISLGQLDLELNQASDSSEPRRVASTDSFRTPTSLAWDGQNLYVSDTFNRRVVLYTPGDFALPITAVRNAPSPDNYAKGRIVLGGTMEADYEISVKIGDSRVKNSDGTTADPTEYKYKTVKDDTFDTVVDQLVAIINESDPYVVAAPNHSSQAVVITARQAGNDGNNVTLSSSVTPSTAKLTVNASGANLTGGQDPSLIAPYAIVTVLGDNLADETTPVADLTQPLPKELGGVQFFVDGLQAPLIAVSPTRILAQIPVETIDATSAAGVLRVQRKDGSVTVSAAVAIPIIGQNPAVYSDQSLDPQPGFAYHYSSSATGTISVDGTAAGGDVIKITINGRVTEYTVQATDTLVMVRDALVALINATDPEVEAFPSGFYSRLRLRARIPGPEGNNIPYSATAASGSSVIVTAFNSTLCCSNEEGAPVTADNPAVPGETIVVLASGLGIVNPQEARDAMTDGMPYYGPALNDASESVSALAGGKTANVLFAGLRRGSVGIYEVQLELNPDLATDPQMQVTIAQSFQVSNIFTLPVVKTKP